jgi:myo-inositol 2-dehydrogenase/D-chiro-inositol 1-dehydrogenase
VTSGERRARVVLIGCGNQANRAIYPCVAAAADLFEVLATADLDEARARATAGRTGAPRTYPDAAAALEETKPDGAFVIGPPAMQGSVAALALERGVPVFTEKPSAPSVAGARHLVDLAAQRGAWGVTGFMKRFNDAYRAARACLERPEFGRPVFLEKHFYAQNPHRREGQSDADLLWQVLLMQGTHALDLVRFFLGDIARTRGQAVFGAAGTCAVSAQLELASGAIGTVQVNTLAGPGNARYLLDVMGDGRAHVRVEDMRRLTYHGGAWNPTRGSDQLQQGYTMEPHPLARRLWTLGHYGEVVAFGRALLAGAAPAPPVPTLVDNLAALQACRAVWRSCTEDGRWIEPAGITE